MYIRIQHVVCTVWYLLQGVVSHFEADELFQLQHSGGEDLQIVEGEVEVHQGVREGREVGEGGNEVGLETQHVTTVHHALQDRNL